MSRLLTLRLVVWKCLSAVVRDSGAALFCQELGTRAIRSMLDPCDLSDSFQGRDLPHAPVIILSFLEEQFRRTF